MVDICSGCVNTNFSPSGSSRSRSPSRLCVLMYKNARGGKREGEGESCSGFLTSAASELFTNQNRLLLLLLLLLPQTGWKTSGLSEHLSIKYITRTRTTQHSTHRGRHTYTPLTWRWMAHINVSIFGSLRGALTEGPPLQPGSRARPAALSRPRKLLTIIYMTWPCLEERDGGGSSATCWKIGVEETWETAGERSSSCFMTRALNCAAKSRQLTSLRRGWCVSHAYTHQISGLLSFHLHTDFITLEPTLSHRGNKRRTWKDGLDDGLKADARFQLRWAAARHRADHSAPMTCLSTSSEDAELHSMTERKCSFRCADVSKSCFFSTVYRLK